jgi:hypothetical protein
MDILVRLESPTLGDGQECPSYENMPISAKIDHIAFTSWPIMGK